MTDVSCGVCFGESGGYYMCFRCIQDLRCVLFSLSDLITELQTQVTKQSVGAPSVGHSPSYEWKIPFDTDASSAAYSIHDTLTHWFLPQIGEEYPFFKTDLSKISVDHYMISWFLSTCVETARLSTGPEMYNDFVDACKLAVDAIDRKESEAWVGDCDCGRSVRAYTDPDSPLYQPIVMCACGELHIVSKARETLKQLGAEQIVSGKDAEALGEIYGFQIKRSTVRTWHARKQLECCRCFGEDVCDGQHIYRFGDILDLHKRKFDTQPDAENKL